MKRKIIQIANSTQLVSLPRKWCLSNNVKKGDEIDVKEKDNNIVVSTNAEPKPQSIEIKFKDYGVLLARFLHSLYKKGVDEINILIEKPENINQIQTMLRNETVGFEIIEQGSKYCLIKNIGGPIEGFDSILRRLMRVLISMAEEGERGLKEGNLPLLKSTIVLEESNNKFTTLCRRYLNKNRTSEGREVGPLYFIVETLEKIADEYKYLFLALCDKKNTKFKQNKDVMKEVEKVTKALHTFYNGFYKKDNKEFVIIAETRKQIIKKWHDLLPKIKDPSEIIIMHHMVVIIQKIFELVGPTIILNVETAKQN